MNKTIPVLIVFALISVLSTLSVMGASCTSVPVEDCTVDGDLTLDFGTYFLNDSNGNGAIIIGANDVTLDCNGATIQGNDTNNGWGIYSNLRTNITIKNCKVANYSRGIYILRNINTTLNNNTMSNSNVNIRIVRSNFTDILNNTFVDTFDSPIVAYCLELKINVYNTTVDNNNFIDCSDRGIQLDTDIYNTIISNNIIMNPKSIGIFLIKNSSYSRIFNNVINGTIPGDRITIRVESDSDYNEIYSNTINYSGWNAIDIATKYNKVYNNTIYKPNHGGIDLCDSGTNGYNSIFNNTLYQKGIFSCAGIHNNITNNQIFDSNGSSVGIIIEGNATFLYGTRVENNLIRNASEYYCLSSGAINTTWINNTMELCGLGNMLIGAWYQDHSQTDNSIFIDNSDISGKVNYTSRSWGQINVTVNETSTNSHLITLFNEGTIKMIGDWRKDFRVENNTITINNMVKPFNDIFNVTSGRKLATNQKTFTVTISPNVEIQVGDFTPWNLINRGPHLGKRLINTGGVLP